MSWTESIFFSFWGLDLLTASRVLYCYFGRLKLQVAKTRPTGGIQPSTCFILLGTLFLPGVLPLVKEQLYIYTVFKLHSALWGNREAEVDPSENDFDIPRF